MVFRPMDMRLLVEDLNVVSNGSEPAELQQYLTALRTLYVHYLQNTYTLEPFLALALNKMDQKLHNRTRRPLWFTGASLMSSMQPVVCDKVQTSLILVARLIHQISLALFMRIFWIWKAIRNRLSVRFVFAMLYLIT